MTTNGSIAIRATVAFTSDWHIGTGRGRAREIDSAIVRDPMGLPYLPAKSFHGVLRDSAEIAAGALDEAESGVFHAWVDYIFGSQPARQGETRSAGRGRPIPAALTGSPLTLSTRLVELIDKAATSEEDAAGTWRLTRGDLSAACAIVRPGVAIDEVAGTALEDQLRFEERARGGLLVGATWRLRCNGSGPEGMWPAALLLGCSARLTDAIGGKRRRGAGRAAVTLQGEGVFGGTDEALAELFSTLENTALGEVPEPPRTASRGADAILSSAPHSDGGGLRHSYDIDIEVITPVLVDTTLRGNTVTSASAVPGSVVLPIVGRALRGKLGQLIRDGRVVVTAANIIVENRRALPWPQCLAISKDNPGDPEAVNLLRPHAFNSRLKPKSGAFLTPHGRGAIYAAVELDESIHAIIEDRTQRPTAEAGGLFVYCGIAPGTRLRAEVWLPKGVCLDESLVEGRRRIGRSVKDDFGDVEITVTKVASETRERRCIPAGEPFTVWLTSDAIVRNDRGVPDPRPAALAAELAAALECGDVALHDGGESPHGESSDAARMSVNRRESWQVAWGLPRPSLVAVAAGSVLTFRATKAIEADRLAMLERTGIGERRAEGYGRLAINHALLQASKVSAVRAASGNCGLGGRYWDDADGDSADRSFQVIVRAAWQRKIAEYALTRSAAIRSHYLPAKTSNSQLGTLRQLLLQLDPCGGGFEHFFAWLSRMQLLVDRNRSEQWNRAELDCLGKLVRSVRKSVCPTDGDRGDSELPTTLIWELLFDAQPADLPEDLTGDGDLALHALKLALIEAIRAAIVAARVTEQPTAREAAS